MDTRLVEFSEEQFRANRFDVVSRLADDLAHEIRNPLNSIVINLEVLRARIAKGDDDSALGRVDVIEEEVRRLHQLVDRMLLLLRPDRTDATSLRLDQALDELLPLVLAQTRLARNELAVDCQAAVAVPLRRDIFKFGLLQLIAAVHDRLGEGGGTLFLSCRTADASITLRIAHQNRDSTAGAASAAVQAAAAVVARLFAPYGGAVHADELGVTVVLPQAVPV